MKSNNEPLKNSLTSSEPNRPFLVSGHSIEGSAIIVCGGLFASEIFVADSAIQLQPDLGTCGRTTTITRSPKVR